MARPSAASGYRRGKMRAKSARRGKGETTEILAGLPDGARVERIVSRGTATPPDYWYDQTEDEWVMQLLDRVRHFMVSGRWLAPYDQNFHPNVLIRNVVNS